MRRLPSLGQRTELLPLLLECGEVAFAEFLGRPAVAALWWPRYEAVAAWVAAQLRARRHLLQKAQPEVELLWPLVVEGREFSISARLDCLHELADGSVLIIDYKTGALPSAADVTEGRRSQMALYALAFADHCTREGRAVPPVSLEYWRLGASADECEVMLAEPNLEQALSQLHALLRRFQDVAQAYMPATDPRLVSAHDDYAHLLRRKEWEGAA